MAPYLERGPHPHPNPNPSPPSTTTTTTTAPPAHTAHMPHTSYAHPHLSATSHPCTHAGSCSSRKVGSPCMDPSPVGTAQGRAHTPITVPTQVPPNLRERGPPVRPPHPVGTAPGGDQVPSEGVQHAPVGQRGAMVVPHAGEGRAHKGTRPRVWLLQHSLFSVFSLVSKILALWVWRGFCNRCAASPPVVHRRGWRAALVVGSNTCRRATTHEATATPLLHTCAHERVDSHPTHPTHPNPTQPTHSH